MCSSAVLPEPTAAAAREYLGLRRPYNDASLRIRKARRNVYQALWDRDMIEWSFVDGVRVGFFGVWKSDGKKVRLIVDARVSNAGFREPEAALLPSAAAFSRMYVEEDEQLC